MSHRPEKCPICGGKVVKITNALTKRFYYQCSNKDCYFVLGENYTEAELYLQGQHLQTGCLKCGAPLTIANGPDGLYPRCFECDCDSRPIFYNGKVYHKWVNAHRKNTAEEMSSLITSFNEPDESEDIKYDFNAFVLSEVPAENNNSEIISVETPTNLEKVMEVLLRDTSKPMGIQDLCLETGIVKNSMRPLILYMKSHQQIKVVGYKEMPSKSCALLYQVPESPLPEITIYTKGEGYSTVRCYAKQNKTKYGHIHNLKEFLSRRLEEKKVRGVLFSSVKGVYFGYSISEMDKVMEHEPQQLFIDLEGAANSRGKSPSDVLTFLEKNLSIPYTAAQIARSLNANDSYVRRSLRNLIAENKVKIVGWKYTKGQSGAVPMKYQSVKSLLQEFPVINSTQEFTTWRKFYKEKLNGKRITSKKKAKKCIADLPVTPLRIDKKVFAGYSIPDLEKTLLGKDKLHS